MENSDTEDVINDKGDRSESSRQNENKNSKVCILKEIIDVNN